MKKITFYANEAKTEQSLGTWILQTRRTVDCWLGGLHHPLQKATLPVTTTTESTANRVRDCGDAALKFFSVIKSAGTNSDLSWTCSEKKIQFIINSLVDFISGHFYIWFLILFSRFRNFISSQIYYWFFGIFTLSRYFFRYLSCCCNSETCFKAYCVWADKLCTEAVCLSRGFQTNIKINDISKR